MGKGKRKREREREEGEREGEREREGGREVGRRREGEGESRHTCRNSLTIKKAMHRPHYYMHMARKRIQEGKILGGEESGLLEEKRKLNQKLEIGHFGSWDLIDRDFMKTTGSPISRGREGEAIIKVFWEKQKREVVCFWGGGRTEVV